MHTVLKREEHWPREVELYVVLLCRCFLQPLHKECAQFPSKIKTSLESTGALDAYKQLQRKDLNWDKKAAEVVTGAENLPTLMLTLPPPAKRQREDGHREGGGSKAEALAGQTD